MSKLGDYHSKHKTDTISADVPWKDSTSWHTLSLLIAGTDSQRVPLSLRFVRVSIVSRSLFSYHEINSNRTNQTLRIWSTFLTAYRKTSPISNRAIEPTPPFQPPYTRDFTRPCQQTSRICSGSFVRPSLQAASFLSLQKAIRLQMS